MSLASKMWTPASLHEVVLAWLQAERHEVARRVQGSWAPLLDVPDLSDAGHNRERLRMMYAIRSAFFLEIPPDTQWYRVENLTDAELSELSLVNHATVTDNANTCDLLKAAPQLNWPLKAPVSNWNAPILWGHSTAGPFTILEGNHRLAAYVNSRQTGLDIPVFAGLSMIACIYHRPDNSGPLIRDILQI